MSVLSQIYLQFARQWSKASTGGRIASVAGIITVVTAVIGTALWSSTPDYKVLRDGISPVIVGEMVSALDTRGIPNKLNYSGSGVLVPTSRWNEANIAVTEIAGDTSAPMDRPSSPSLFPTQTGFSDQLRLKEQQLKRSIESLQGINSASVHIAMSKPSPFRKNQHPTSASVIVGADPQFSISKELGATIVRIVASAVEGLGPEAVTLTSADGSLVENVANDDPASTRRGFVRRIEVEKAIQAQDVLAASLGANKAVVRVTAELDDFLERTITQNKILADDKVRLSETLTTKDEKGGTPTATGAAGTSSNGLGAGGSATDSSAISKKEETNTTTYDYPRIVETSREVGGNLKRLSISATVDVTRDVDDGAGNVTTVSVLTQEQVENLIKMAVGFDQARGDQIQVVLAEIPESPLVADAVPDSKQWEFVSQLARNASLGLAAVVALLIGVMTLNKLKPIEVTNNGNRQNELMTELSRRVDQNPEAVSKILSAWLSQESGEKGGSDSPATIPVSKAA